MALSSNSIYTLAPGRHHDGRGLYLSVAASGRRSWLARVRFAGKETTVKLGDVSSAFGLAQARKAHNVKLADAARGIDPRPAQKEKPIAVDSDSPTALCKLWYAYSKVCVTSGVWTPEHAVKTTAQIEKHIAPLEIWTKDASTLTRPQFIEAAEAIESLEVRMRVYRWLGACMDNGVDEGVLTTTPFGRSLPKKLVRPKSDRGSLQGEITDLDELRDLLARSWYYDAALSVRAVHRVVALTGHRIGAILQAEPHHFNRTADTFTVPRANMKTDNDGRDVVIGPLSPPLRDVLVQAQDRALAIESPWLFPNASGADPITHAAVEKHVRRLDARKFTPHSWRSVLMTWALEQYNDRELAQLLLDHARGTDSDRAYDRSTLPAKRSGALIAWAKVIV